MKPTYALLLNWNLDVPGGVNEVVKNLYKEFEEDQRVSPVIMINDGHCQRLQIRLENGRRTIRMRLRAPFARRRLLINFLLFLFEMPYALWRNRKFVHQLNVVSVNLHYPGLSAVNWAILKKLGLFSGRVILSLHGRDFRDAIQTVGVEYRLWKWLLHHVDWIVTCSDGLASEVTDEFSDLLNKTVSIHNGIDISHIELVARKHDRPAFLSVPGKYILNIGTFEHKKGQDILIRSFAQTIDDLPLALNLVMVGRTAEKWGELQRLAEELGVTNRIQMLRDLKQENVTRILHNAELFVLSSRNEAFSIALLEAAALAIPIVATDVCGVSELIPSDDYGTVVPTEDPDELSTAISNAIRDRRAALTRSERLRNRVRQQFQWGAAKESYLALLD